MSYARDRATDEGANTDLIEDNLKLIDTFHKELSKELIGKLESGNVNTIVFRDSRSIKTGSEWADVLQNALQEYPIGLVLLQRSYLAPKRPWCRWEFDYFQRRNGEVSKFSGSSIETHTLFMVKWLDYDDNPTPQEFPRNIQIVDESIVDGDTGRTLDEIRHTLKFGLKSTVQGFIDKKNVDVYAFRTFIRLLGNEIYKQWINWGKVTKLNPEFLSMRPRKFDEEFTWTPAKTTNSREQPTVREITRKPVYVVYFAAKPDKDKVPDDRVGRYLERGESDWRPFNDKAAKPIGAYIKTLEEKISGVTVDPWEFDYFSRDIAARLSDAKDRYPVIIVLDPWTATNVSRYRLTLESCAKKMAKHHTFKVPVIFWNKEDKVTEALRNDFRKHIFKLFEAQNVIMFENEDEVEIELSNNLDSLFRKIRKIATESMRSSGSKPPQINAT
jgi:hypothetical protein